MNDIDDYTPNEETDDDIADAPDYPESDEQSLEDIAKPWSTDDLRLDIPSIAEDEIG